MPVQKRRQKGLKDKSGVIFDMISIKACREQ